MFEIGDLVVPAWKTQKPHGFGIVYGIKQDIHKITISVCWQLQGTTQEHITDIKVVQQALD
jgi:hypothetical protein